MTVLAVVSILAFLGSMALNSVLYGSALNRSGQMVMNELVLARQMAQTQNHPMEVRLYTSTSPSGTASTSAIQTYEVPDTGAKTPMDKAQFLPNAILIDTGTYLSSIATLTAQNATSSVGGTGTGYTYLAFHFRPDGSTDLDSSRQWYLTLHQANYGQSLTQSPKNYFSIQIDPLNGHANSFRP